MIPDLAQEGTADEKAWSPTSEAPVVMFNNVGKPMVATKQLGEFRRLSGGVTGILGLNGAGKSTLFKLLMGKLNRPKAKYDCLEQILGKSCTLCSCWLRS